MSRRTITHKADPKLDLVLERVVDVPPNLVCAAWTMPDYVKQWFTPAPWQTVDCEIDLRPGGVFRFVMRSPEGQEFPNVGCECGLFLLVGLADRGDALGVGGEGRDAGALDLQQLADGAVAGAPAAVHRFG
jgi:hypothetical protein